MSVEEMSGQMLFDGMPQSERQKSNRFEHDGFARVRQELGSIAAGDFEPLSTWYDGGEVGWQMPLPIAKEFIDVYTVRQEDYIESLNWCVENMDERLSTLESSLVEAQRDPLTGLMSLPQFKDVLTQHVEIQQQLADAERERPDQIRRRDIDRKGLIVLTIDLDGFKHVNDTYGHAAGDNVLITAAHIMTDSVREQDHVCRSGGDEFLVLLNDGVEAHDFVSIARRIRGGLSRIEIDGCQGLVGASIGGAAFCDGMNADQLVKESDDAMYDDKARKAERGF